VSKFLLSLLLLTTSSGRASSIQFVSLPGNTQFGTFNGWVTSTVDGVPLQQLICDDYNHETYVPSGPVEFTVSTLLGDSILQYARFFDPKHAASSITKYEEAAVLLDGLRNTGPGSILDLTADYQYALWYLFTPTVNLPNQTAKTLLSDAAKAVARGDPATQALYSELVIYTPTAKYSSNQEFLQLKSPILTGMVQDFPAGGVPESGSGTSVGIGLVAIAIASGARHLLLRR